MVLTENQHFMLNCSLQAEHALNIYPGYFMFRNNERLLFRCETETGWNVIAQNGEQEDEYWVSINDEEGWKTTLVTWEEFYTVQLACIKLEYPEQFDYQLDGLRELVQQ
jgi:hypothetical protein